MKKILIVNADDLGLSQAVTKGIILAHNHGIVTSTTVMMNLPDAKASIIEAIRLAPNLGLGVHINLTKGSPASSCLSVPNLVDSEGHFLNREVFIERIETIPLSEVEEECKAQINQFTQITGKSPDHIDCHHHVLYASEKTIQLLIDLARDLNIPIRNPLNLVDSRNAKNILGFSNEKTQNLLKFLNAQKTTPIQTTDFFINGLSGEITVEYLLTLIKRLPNGVTELMVHPGLVDSKLIRASKYSHQRKKELDIITDERIVKFVNQNKIALVNFGYLTNK